MVVPGADGALWGSEQPSEHAENSKEELPPRLTGKVKEALEQFERKKRSVQDVGFH